MHNDQRTPSMNSLGDAHTPSESPEASSSESSTGGDWESGEFKTELVEHWPKQRTFSNSKSKNKKLANFKSNNTNTANTAITTSTSSMPAKLSQQHQFKAKSNSIKIFNNTSNLSSSNSVSVNVNINNNVNVSKLGTKKMRWLWNMRSDPDFHETIVKTVNIQTTSELGGRQSSDSLDIYSTICDKELSVSGSPYKSPNDRVASLLSDQMKIRSRTNSFTKRYSQRMHLSPSNSTPMYMHMHMHANKNQSPHDQDCTSSASVSPSSENCDPVLIVAKPIESQAIGFNVVDTRNERENAAGKLQCDLQAGTGDVSSLDADNAKKRSESGVSSEQFSEKLSSKRPKSNDFVEIHVSASSSSPLSIANEQNSFFDFSLGQSIDHIAKHSKMIIGPDSSMDTSASNSPTDENPQCDLPSFKDDKVNPTKSRSKHNLPPMKSASTSSATDCDEVDSSKVVTLSWSNDVRLLAGDKQSTSNLCGSNDLTARSSISSNSTTSSSSSSSLTNIKRNRPPFSFREIRNELRTVMRQNRKNSK